MRIPISWLRDWVDVPAGITPAELHAVLVGVGFEEEAVHGGQVAGPVVVGRILSHVEEPQSNGKTISWCQVDVGEAEPRGIVCGAPNVADGVLVVVTLPGASLPGPTPEQPFVIAARKTYGHVSDGMIASGRELGLTDDHSGIIHLADLGIDAVPGTDALPLLGLDDWAVEINVTPDRGYAMSIRGVAREVANATGWAFRDPALAVTVAEPDGAFPLRVADQAPIRGRAGSDGFVVRSVVGVDRSIPTPGWMATRLRLAGIRSISLPVDISNYVMLETGHPIHTYDAATLLGGITVRRAEPGERLTTLDGVDRALSPEDLLICDDRGPIGLAGVMGGGSTEISDTTTDILVEAAHFDPVSIARTARRHKLPSEASKRYERGVDPALSPAAAQRVVDLLVTLAGGTATPLGAVLADYAPPQPIELPAAFIPGLIGVDYSSAEIARPLTAIGAEVGETADGWRVTPPTWRPDLIDKWSLAEEVARIQGLDRIPSRLPVAPDGRGLTQTQRLRRVAAQALAGQGLTEISIWPFVSESEVQRYTPGAASMRLANALDAAVDRMRTSLLPGLVATARRNLARGLTDVALFELGLVFLPETDARYGSDAMPDGTRRPDAATLDGLYASLPAQPWHAGAIFVGDAVRRQPGVPAVPSGIADAVVAAKRLAAAIGAPLDVRTGEHPALHPGRTAALVVGDRQIGVAGELLPSLAAELDLPRVVAVLELDLEALMGARLVPAASPVPTLPAATQDVSLVVPVATPAGELLRAFVAGAGELLEDARLVDDYRGAGVPEGSKSLTLALRFRAVDRTLTQAEATESKLAGVAAAAAGFGATIRE